LWGGMLKGVASLTDSLKKKRGKMQAEVLRGIWGGRKRGVVIGVVR